MPLGGVDHDNVIRGLNAIANEIKHELSKRLTIRRTPRLKFVLDESFDIAGRVTSLIYANQSQDPSDEDEQS